MAVSSTSIGVVWSELDHRFEKDIRGRLKKAINFDALVSSIDNILRTGRGERVMLPSFGLGLTNVFEPMSKLSGAQYARKIKEAITRWDDRIIIHAVDCVQRPNQSQVEFKIQLGVRGFSEIFEHKLTTSIGD